MIQVQEMLIVTAGREAEGVQRLQNLFELMAQQPGFSDATVGRGIEDPSRLLVLHAWQQLDNWKTFSASPTKIGFTASRPDGLYQFEAAGMNWHIDSSSGNPHAAAAVRRTVYKEGAAPTHGSVIADRTCLYLDDEPRFEGATLQLSYYDSLQSYRIARVPVGRRARAYLADEGYELVAHKAGRREPVTSTRI